MTFNLKDKDILIAGQLKTSLTENLESFLVPRAKTVGVIGISSPFATINLSRCTLYRDGEKIKEWQLPAFTLKKVTTWNYPLITFSYLVFVYSFLLAFLHMRKRFDIYIGISTFSTIFGMTYKIFGGTRKLIYYCLDYYVTPKGYGFRRWLNFLFRVVEPRILRSSDFVWNLSSRIRDAHVKFFGFRPDEYPQAIVPVSYRGSFSRNLSLGERERWTIGFVGSLSENQGLQLVIEALPELIKKYPQINVRVIGHGLFAGELQKMVKERGLHDKVLFYGFIADENKVNALLSRCMIGLATYTGAFMDNSLFTEPGKPKLYLMLGLPVIVTESISLSNLIEENKAGKKIPYEKGMFIAAVEEIIGDDNRFQEYRKGVESAKPFCRSEYVYQEAFSQSACWIDEKK